MARGGQVTRTVAAPWAAIELPERSRLDQVRHLAAHFGQARLREAAVVRAPELDERADASGATRVWLALESLQVTGSFKVRGALVALAAAAGRGDVVAASAGNHGAAVSYAARVLSIRATVVVPRAAPQAKRRKIEAYGAQMIVADSDHYDDAEDLAKRIAAERAATFVSPYDDENVVLGNGASLGFEIVRALGRVPDRVLAPFGGGGLATGLAWAMAADAGRPSSSRIVWGVQSEASCAMAMSLERGHAVERLETGGTTLAEGLEGGISRRAFERARRAVAGVAVVGEREIADAMAYAHRDLGLVVEGSAAAALAPTLVALPEPLRGGDVVAVLTGRNVDGATLDGVVPR